MTNPPIYFTTAPHTCVCREWAMRWAAQELREGLHASDCPARCRAAAEDDGVRRRTQRQAYLIQCEHEFDHDGVHTGRARDGSTVVWR